MICLRELEAREIGGAVMIAATEFDGRVWASFLSGSSPEPLSDALADACLSMKQIGSGLLVEVARGALDAQSAEPEVFADRNVLLAIRNGETPEAVRDWLDYHVKSSGVTGALIVDRSGDELTGVLDGLSCQILILRVNVPLGKPGHPPADDAALAPAAPARMQENAPVPDPWLAPFGETILLETLRRRYLSAARAVAFLDIADLLMPDDESSPFDRANDLPGSVIPLVGRELYPWRLRQGTPARHVDNICARLNETRSVSRWCVAPGDVDNGLFWRLIRVGGAKIADGPPVRFLRAMGVAFPGVATGQIVAKPELVEDSGALKLMQRAFPEEPVRMPERKVPSVDPRSARSVTIITAMKNEGPFIVDWIAHNRAIGIANILVYTNDCTDGTDRLLDALADEEIVVHRVNPYREKGAVPQHAAFRAAESEGIVTEADWLLTLDVDEYINIHKGSGHMNDLFDAVPDANLISMPWRIFGNADIHRFDPAPVAHQFQRCANAFSPKPHQAWGFKTLFRNAKLFRRLSVHRPRGMYPQAVAEINWVNGSGEPLPTKMWQSAWRVGTRSWGYDLVSLNHYAVRSAESFLVKRDRGRVNHTTRDQGLAYWFRMNHNAVEDVSIRRLDDRVERERDRLMALPGVAEAHEAAVDWHRNRIGQLKESAMHAELYGAITSPRLEKLSRMLGHFGTNVFLAGPQVIPDEIVGHDPGDDFFFTVPREARA